MPEGKNGYEPRGFPARVVEVLDDDFRVVINRGMRDGIKSDQRFMVYALGDSDITDPETGESLGKLEIVRGHGVVSHLQDKITTIKSAKKTKPSKTVRKSSLSVWTIGPSTEEIIHESEDLPFDNPQINDLVKPL